jgi:hypothetical protein
MAPTFSVHSALIKQQDHAGQGCRSRVVLCRDVPVDGGARALAALDALQSRAGRRSRGARSSAGTPFDHGQTQFAATLQAAPPQNALLTVRAFAIRPR